MIIHYCPDLNADYYFLDEEESKHCIKVLRKNTGDKINIIDGKGNFYVAEISNPNPKKCEFKIIEKTYKPKNRKYKLHVAIAPTKNMERFEWFLEKAVEIGIDEITPLITTHSERKILKDDRLEKIIISTLKQAQELYLPKLNVLTKFSDFIKNQNATEKFIAHCYENTFEAEKNLLKNVYKNSDNVLIIIGPEGDFSPEEVKTALLNNFLQISLGENRLRTETAGIVVCNTISIMNM